MAEETQAWSSRTLFILAAVGSAVGIGNIWRFPYIFATNGGAVFLLPYLLFVFLFGLPLMLLETSAGAKLREGFPSAVARLKLPAWIGWIPIIFSGVILSYYTVITGWTLYHASSLVLYGTSSFSASVEPLTSLLFGAAVLSAAAWVAIRGVKGGIEPVLKLAAPLFIAGLLALLAYSLSLPGTLGELQKLFAFDPNGLLDGRVWLFAASQAIFSLSVGYAILYTYGAYLKNAKALGTSLLAVAAIDTLVALVAVAVVLPIALASGGEGGFSVAFDSALNLFAVMPYGAVFGAVFFALLFLAAFTSVISMMEAPVLAVKDYFKFPRCKAVIRVGLVLLPLVMASGLSYSSAFSNKLPAIEFLDLVFGSLLAPLSALIVAWVVAWRLNPAQLFKEAGVPWLPSKLVLAWTRWVIPALLAGLSVIAFLHLR